VPQIKQRNLLPQQQRGSDVLGGDEGKGHG